MAEQVINVNYKVHSVPPIYISGYIERKKTNEINWNFGNPVVYPAKDDGSDKSESGNWEFGYSFVFCLKLTGKDINGNTFTHYTKIDNIVDNSDGLLPIFALDAGSGISGTSKKDSHTIPTNKLSYYCLKNTGNTNNNPIIGDLKVELYIKCGAMTNSESNKGCHIAGNNAQGKAWADLKFKKISGGSTISDPYEAPSWPVLQVNHNPDYPWNSVYIYTDWKRGNETDLYSETAYICINGNWYTFYNGESKLITGLNWGTTYSVYGYIYDGRSYVYTSTEYITTYYPPHVLIYSETDNIWHRAIPYIYSSNAWHMCEAYEYTNNNWRVTAID